MSKNKLENINTKCPECGRNDYKKVKKYETYGYLVKCNNCEINYFCKEDKKPLTIIRIFQKYRRNVII